MEDLSFEPSFVEKLRGCSINYLASAALSVFAGMIGVSCTLTFFHVETMLFEHLLQTGSLSRLSI